MSVRCVNRSMRLLSVQEKQECQEWCRDACVGQISRDACLAKGADRAFDKTTELEAMLDYLGGLIEN